MRFNFKNINTIAVFGLKGSPDRPAYRVSKYMQDHGFRIIPINPLGEEVLGEKGYQSINDVPPEISIDLADYFINPEKVVPLVQDALKRGIKLHWLQSGIINNEAAHLVRENGAEIVMDRCIMIEYQAARNNSL